MISCIRLVLGAYVCCGYCYIYIYDLCYSVLVLCAYVCCCYCCYIYLICFIPFGSGCLRVLMLLLFYRSIYLLLRLVLGAYVYDLVISSVRLIFSLPVVITSGSNRTENSQHYLHQQNAPALTPINQLSRTQPRRNSQSFN